MTCISCNICPDDDGPAYRPGSGLTGATGWIDWMTAYANPPTLHLRLESVPARDSFRWMETPIADGLSLLWAEVDGHIRMMVEDLSDPTGYDGSSFTIRMTDDSVRTVVGPWSGNPSAFQVLGLPRVVEFQDRGVWRLATHTAIEAVLPAVRVPDYEPGRFLLSCGHREVRFPGGTRCGLYDDDTRCSVPYAIMPDGSTWRKGPAILAPRPPPGERRTPASAE